MSGAALLAALAAGAGSITIEPHERIVFVGDAFFERENAYGHLETELLAAFPQTPMKVRNLGWSGDTPGGASRAYFDPPERGFERLCEQIAACEPTMVVVGYGMADALSGTTPEAFGDSIERLLDRLPKSAKKVVLASPIPRSLGCGRVGPPGESSESVADRLLRAYPRRLLEIARRRGGEFLDTYNFLSRFLAIDHSLYGPGGLHLDERGYSVLARYFWTIPDFGDITTGEGASIPERFRGKLSSPFPLETLELRGETLHWGEEQFAGRGAAGRLEFAIAPKRLPTASLLPARVEWKGFDAGLQGMEIDGEPAAPAAEGGVDPFLQPWVEQREALRTLVCEKNRLYFQRYRPQNITYLLGFRAYEQGQNAKEIEALDPMIEELERRIDAMRTPKTVHVAWKRLEK
jgi:lysophospholipase L1-like esterase